MARPAGIPVRDSGGARGLNLAPAPRLADRRKRPACRGLGKAIQMISVAMITMNEEKAVGSVIADIRTALDGREHEIVIVDSSRDSTPEIAEGLGARVIRQFPPEGYGYAMARVLQE